MNRQIRESLEIRNKNPSVLLNSKSEFYGPCVKRKIYDSWVNRTSDLQSCLISKCDDSKTRSLKLYQIWSSNFFKLEPSKLSFSSRNRINSRNLPENSQFFKHSWLNSTMKHVLAMSKSPFFPCCSALNLTPTSAELSQCEGVQGSIIIHHPTTTLLYSTTGDSHLLPRPTEKIQ